MQIKRGLIRDKKAIEIIYPSLIFIILNLIFISMLFVFVMRSPGHAVAYEQIYAKKIALLIDRAKPGMEISLDVGEAQEIAEKNKINSENILEIKNNKVFVSLAEGGAYSFNYFSEYDVDYSVEDNFLKLKINEKQND